MAQDRIRNVKGFLRSYMKSSSGERALSRQPRFDEVSTDTIRGRVNFKFNTMAIALQEAVNGA